MRIYVALILLLFGSCVFAQEDFRFYEIDPFYNFSIEFSQSNESSRNTVLNPVRLQLNQYRDALDIKSGGSLKIRVLKGEKAYKGILIQNANREKNINVRLNLAGSGKYFNRSNTNLNLVTTWFQSGRDTIISKNHKYLTHELLVKNDFAYSFKDGWKNSNDKWYYIPPEIVDQDDVSTLVPENDIRRLLVEINVPDKIEAGIYQISLEVTNPNSGIAERTLPIEIEVVNNHLRKDLKDKYDLFIYTMLSLDPNVGRINSYINGQNYLGSYQYQKDMYRQHIKNIKNHGFNGVIVTDWREPYINDALGILREEGIKNVAIYANSPTVNKAEIVTKGLVDILGSYGFKAIFYGYDEPGGNKQLQDQINLNQKINGLGAQSFNACFWDDMPDVIDQSFSEDSKRFAYLAYSMGSHGNKRFINSLPLTMKKPGLKNLAYWHPHVENPINNKLLMGYWLWASGLDGLSPHGYYFLPHISKYMQSDFSKRQTRLSPYNDFGMWDEPSSMFRQHATVYPRKNGVLNTLQWEGLSDGVTDLMLVSQLEEFVNNSTKQALKKLDAKKLLFEIKNNALVKNASSLSESDTYKYMYLMREWRNRIKTLLND